MDFKPEHYFEAALERRDEARSALARKEYTLALWIAGVAVECVLRAYRARINPEFDARHNIPELLKQSRLLGFIESDARTKGRSEPEIFASLQEVRAAINAVGRLWHNNYRYASSDRLRSHLKAAGLSTGIKGDFLKDNARKLVEASTRIIDVGERLWVSSGKN